MNGLLKGALYTLTASIIGIVWGGIYVNDHPLGGVGAFFGRSDPLYTMAGWSTVLGILGLLIGIGLLIGGLVTKSRPADSD